MKVKHSGNAGDIMYALPAIKKLWGRTGERVDLFIKLDVIGHYTKDMVHPLGKVMMNRKMYEYIKPLLLNIPYIGSVSIEQGEAVDYDFDLFRKARLNTMAGNISRWYFYVYPELSCELNDPTIRLPKDEGYESFKDVVVINRSQRYHNPNLSYYCLNDIKQDVVFIGLEQEFKELKMQINNLEYEPTDDLLDAANIIRHSKLFIGNQSLMFAVAEQLKVKRVLELCDYCPNVIPTYNGVDCWFTENLEWHLNNLLYG